MTKVTMLEPVARVRVGSIIEYEHIDVRGIDRGVHNLITTDQAEAYKDACVREALAAQKPYGYHIVSEENGNGIAFCPSDHAEQITEFLKLNPGTTIRAVAIIPPTNKG